jgi:hypothetical protein
MLDVWRIVLGYLQDDFDACMRLMVAVPGLHERAQDDAALWRALERVVVHRPMYQVYTKVHKHLGRTKRLTRWAAFCAAPCTGCGMPMGGQAANTFATGRKLCTRCREGSMVSETVVGTLSGVRFAWMQSPAGGRHRHYHWYDVFTRTSSSAHLHP